MQIPAEKTISSIGRRRESVGVLRPTMLADARLQVYRGSMAKLGRPIRAGILAMVAGLFPCDEA